MYFLKWKRMRVYVEGDLGIAFAMIMAKLLKWNLVPRFHSVLLGRGTSKYEINKILRDSVQTENCFHSQFAFCTSLQTAVLSNLYFLPGLHSVFRSDRLDSHLQRYPIPDSTHLVPKEILSNRPFQNYHNTLCLFFKILHKHWIQFLSGLL